MFVYSFDYPGKYFGVPDPNDDPDEKERQKCLWFSTTGFGVGLKTTMNKPSQGRCSVDKKVKAVLPFSFLKGKSNEYPLLP